MSKKTKKPTRQALIEELESIHKSLVDDKEAMIDLGRDTDADKKSPCANHEHPALDLAQPKEKTTTVNKENARSSDKMEDTKNIDESLSAVLPGQQSLFDDSDAAPNSSDKVKPPTSVEQQKENPFLPKHLRNKLKHERSLYEQDIEAASQLQNLKTDSPIDKETAESMVDELVAVYLPKIESELREKLTTKLEDLVKDD